jgi:iron complex outermembrane receptor protein
MRFRDEIARTGATTPLGYDLRANVGRSYRRGVEFDAAWLVTPTLDIGVTASASRNRIAEYRDAGSGGTYRNVEPILTPTFQAGHRVTWQVADGMRLSADGRCQGRSFLAPLGDTRLTAAAFYVLDGGIALALGGRTLSITGRNLLDRRAYPSGDVSGGAPRYFILAPRSVDLSVWIPLAG